MASDTAGQKVEDQSKAKVFISYSRKDIAFADHLEAALKARGFEPLIDRTEIYAFEEWWQRIEALIARADTVVFVLSPDSVASDIALREVSFAASLNKRFAPIVCRRAEDEQIPEALAKLNFIFFDDPARFEASADQLAEALNTDISWIRQHTEFGEQARRWAQARRPSGLLLRSPVLEQAERWIAGRPRGAPAPTEETQSFIRQSRQAATRRRNILTSSLAAGLLLALGLAGLAYWQRGIAIEQGKVAQEQRKLAEEQRDIAEKRRATALAELSNSERLRGNLDTALRLGIHAAQLALSLGTDVAGQRAALEAAMWECDWGLLITGENFYSAMFSPDGNLIVTADKKTVRIWDSGTGAKLRALQGHTDNVSAAQFSPDGTLVVTASKDGTARIWEVATGNQIVTFNSPLGAVTSASFSPSGKQVVITAPAAWVEVRDIISGKITRLPTEATFAAFSQDGRRVVTAPETGYEVSVWDTGTGRLLTTLEGHNYTVSTAQFSPDGKRIVTASRDRTSRVWDLESNNKSIVLAGHQNVVNYASFSPDGTQVITASNDKTARIWDADTGKEIAVLRGHEAWLTSAVFSSDGKRIATAGSWEGTVRIWSARTNKMPIKLEAKSPQTNLVFSRDGKYLLTDSDEVQVWDTATRTEVSVLSNADRSWHHGAPEFSQDGRRIAGPSHGNTATIWDRASGNPIVVLRGHEDLVLSAFFTPDNNQVVTGSRDGTVRIWEAITGQQIAVLAKHPGSLKDIALSPDGTHIITIQEGYTIMWETLADQEPKILWVKERNDIIQSVFSPDGKRVFTTTASDDIDIGVIWDVETGLEVALPKGAWEPSNGVFSPDGGLLAVGSSIWDAATGRKIRTLRGHNDSVNTVAFSPDGKHLLTTSHDNTARIWDSVTGLQIAVLANEEQMLESAVFSPDGMTVVTGTDGGPARIWDSKVTTLSITSLLFDACSARLRGITRLGQDEMRLAGYSDDTPQIDVCAGIK